MRAGSRLWLVAVAALLPVAAAAWSTGRAGDRQATLSGRVVHAITGDPLAGAIVALRHSSDGVAGGAPDTAFLTDAAGRFTIRAGKAGGVNLTASKTGYLDTHRGRVFTLADGESVDDIVIALTPSSLISGRVIDPAGRPVANAAVRLVAQGESPSSRAARSASTDERGAFTIDRLEAGTYVAVAARSVGESVQVVSDAQTEVIVGMGEERTGIDLVVSMPADAMATSLISQRGARGALSQLSSQQRSSIDGVVRKSSGEPMAGARVVAVGDIDLSGQRVTATWMTETDSNGSYRLQQLPAGSFRIGAGDFGGWMFFHGATRAHQPGLLVSLAAGERRTGIDVTVGEPGAISGVVRDEFGDPVRAAITLLAESFPRGISGFRTTATDDRGRFRIGGLPTGSYVLYAVREPATPLRRADGLGGEEAIAPEPTFYPGVPTLDAAARIVVEVGTELQRMDIVARHVPAASVIWSIVTPGEAPVDGVVIRHLTTDPMQSASPTRTDGRTVTFDAVPAGRSTFIASATVRTARGATRFFGMREISTDGRTPYAADMMLEPGARLSGRVLFDGTGSRPERPEIRLQHVPIPPTPAMPTAERRYAVDPSGTFQIADAMPGRYVIETADTPELSAFGLSKATLGGMDVLDRPFEVFAGSERSDLVLTLTDTLPVLSGTVRDASGRPLPEAEFVVVAADSRYHWPRSRRMRRVVSGADGTYSVALPAGDYIVGAAPAPSLTATLLARPDRMPPIARVSLVAGQRTSFDVRIAR
jgi:hypothetical protein